eukprot:TRINITY_DN4936_c0_g1_i2.p2 TRINITY_DN4936_c0_g1~~TRINITY_DN4936_c0_g1_i2.p2  ORF type:complete len:141 (+),score=47.96 TRINITY_DN4936_c0_g1_i2:310-732(+)
MLCPDFPQQVLERAYGFASEIDGGTPAALLHSLEANLYFSEFVQQASTLFLRASLRHNSDAVPCNYMLPLFENLVETHDFSPGITPSREAVFMAFSDAVTLAQEPRTTTFQRFLKNLATAEFVQLTPACSAFTLSPAQCL